MTNISRRAALSGAALLLQGVARPGDLAAPQRALAELEKKTGARIGVAAIDTGNGHGVFHREAERFVMCSSFKLSLAAATLAKADKGGESLSRMVHYDRNVPLGVSPATRKNVERGMTVGELCEAAMIYSDNGAANLLLAALGGPPAMTRFWRGLGDTSTRLDDNEPKLNLPNGDHNTSTPTAMLGDLRIMLLGNALSPHARAQLLAWMAANTTGGEMLRAGLPAGWHVGDKTGRNPDFGFTNDLAIITPPGRKPILAVCYSARSQPAVLAEVGRILGRAFA